jgi:hypothetical protein
MSEMRPLGGNLVAMAIRNFFPARSLRQTKSMDLKTATEELRNMSEEVRSRHRAHQLGSARGYSGPEGCQSRHEAKDERIANRWEPELEAGSTAPGSH